MSEKQTRPNPKKANDSTSGPHPELQERFDEANEQGYFGIVTDETPNEAYTIKGVTKAAKGGK